MAKESGDKAVFNVVDMVPAEVKVQQAERWKNKDTSKIKDFTTIVATNDWTFRIAKIPEKIPMVSRRA